LKGIRLGLDRVHRMLELLGHPEHSFASVLIAGTNGKGSVSCLVESVLRRSGYSTGLFTSPHLKDVYERVRVQGRSIPPSAWARLSGRVQRLSRRHRVPLTEFEAHTLIAFAYFSEQGVDIAVVEVGLGGRLDATNALPAPEVTVVTSIGHDHLDWLGPTLRHVLQEKLGICRLGTPHVQSVPPRLEALSRRFCRDRLVPAFCLRRDFFVEARGTDWRRPSQSVDVRLPHGSRLRLTVPFLGRHQRDNAALAAAACDALRQRGWRISESALRAGMAGARWPGRFQVVRPLGRKGPVVILDGAHNVEAAQSLAAAYEASPWSRGTATLIFGCLKDKDASGMIKELSPLVHRALTVPLETPRTRDPKTLAEMWSAYAPAQPCGSLEEAWRLARGERPKTVLITGSLYLIGEALKKFGGKI
jgi:dihydrofolate synthase / folylpolyglutamate synthase